MAENISVQHEMPFFMVCVNRNVFGPVITLIMATGEV